MVLDKGGSMFLIISGSFHEFHNTKKEAIEAIEDIYTCRVNNFTCRLFEISKEYEFKIVDVEEKREITETVQRVEFTDV